MPLNISTKILRMKSQHRLHEIPRGKAMDQNHRLLQLGPAMSRIHSPSDVLTHGPMGLGFRIETLGPWESGDGRISYKVVPQFVS